MIFYVELRTMTKWRKVGETFEPIGDWKINRDPDDVLDKGIFAGPYQSEEKRT